MRSRWISACVAALLCLAGGYVLLSLLAGIAGLESAPDYFRASGQFLFESFSWASIWVPAYLFLGALLAALPTFRRDWLAVLTLSTLPFLTASLFFRVLAGDDASPLAAFFVTLLGTRGGAFVILLMFIVEALLIFRVWLGFQEPAPSEEGDEAAPGPAGGAWSGASGWATAPNGAGGSGVAGSRAAPRVVRFLDAAPARDGASTDRNERTVISLGERRVDDRHEATGAGAATALPQSAGAASGASRDASASAGMAASSLLERELDDASALGAPLPVPPPIGELRSRRAFERLEAGAAVEGPDERAALPPPRTERGESVGATADEVEELLLYDEDREANAAGEAPAELEPVGDERAAIDAVHRSQPGIAFRNGRFVDDLVGDAEAGVDVDEELDRAPSEERADDEATLEELAPDEAASFDYYRRVDLEAAKRAAGAAPRGPVDDASAQLGALTGTAAAAGGASASGAAPLGAAGAIAGAAKAGAPAAAVGTASGAASAGAAGAPLPVKPPKRTRYAVPLDTLLNDYPDGEYWVIDEETERSAQVLMKTLEEFNIQAEVTGIRKGPVITMFEILPAPGVKLSKIVNLADNIALRLAAQRVRIVAPIPGKHAVGIEVPNKHRAIVSFKEMIGSEDFAKSKMEIPIILGKDITGGGQIVDLVQTPHLLIAGATGSGKSVCVNSIICSILYTRTPEQVRMILIDPKIVELKLYNDIPHLLTPVITESKKAFQALQYCIYEMERRYSLLDSMGVRDIRSYNRRIHDRRLATTPLPYIVVIIDEFADLMATTGKELESTLARLAAMSRAVGIHLVIATQRPSIDVITGLIKANIPSRIAFMVAGKFDSRIIIDGVGAEMLLGRGDMLFTSAWDPTLVRIQGAYLSEEEVERVTDHVRTLGEPDYIDEEIFIDDDADDFALIGDDGADPMYDAALDIVVAEGKASASYLQRRLKIGYNRAARIVEEMEQRGVVGPQQGSKPREVIHVPDRVR